MCYVPTGHLLFALDGTLHAVLFDLRRLEISGEPIELSADMDNDVLHIGPVSMIYHRSTAGLSTEAIPMRDHAGNPPNER
jgi:hypothetical protein